MTRLQYAIITNAAGMVKTIEEARALLNSAVTRITLGSYTVAPRSGNLGETYYYDSEMETAWNSKGLNNRGIEELMTWLPDFYEECREADKQLAVSIAGFSPEEYAELARCVNEFCDLVEVNGGCGNIWKNNEQKPIVSYVPELLNEVLWQVSCATHHVRRLSVKISPVDNELLPKLASVLRERSTVREVIGVNTMPNQKPAVDKRGKEHLAWRESEGAQTKHTGGMSGSSLRFDSARVQQGLQPLIPGIRYISCGGISDGRILAGRLKLGADGVAIGTTFFERGAKVFSNLLEEAADLS